MLLGVSESSVHRERPECPSLEPSGREVPWEGLSRTVPSADWKETPGGAVEDLCGRGRLEVRRPMRNQDSYSLTRPRAGTPAGLWWWQEGVGVMNRSEGYSRLG